MNPCKCGMAGEPGHRCARGDRCRSDYQARLSGPLLDRIDLRIEVPSVKASDLIRPTEAESSASVAVRVSAARDIQRRRYETLGLPGITTNARCSAALIEEIASPDAAGLKLLPRRQRETRVFRPRLSSHPESGADIGRSGRRPSSRGRLHLARGNFLPDGQRTAQPGGVIAFRHSRRADGSAKWTQDCQALIFVCAFRRTRD